MKLVANALAASSIRRNGTTRTLSSRLIASIERFRPRLRTDRVILVSLVEQIIFHIDMTDDCRIECALRVGSSGCCGFESAVR